MRKQNRPTIPDPFMEIDFTLRSFRREIRRLVIDTQHRFLLVVCGQAATARI
jgi:hypothetical protein